MAREREAAFLTGPNDAFAIYRLKNIPTHDPCVSLAQLQKSGESPLCGNYDLIHTVQIGPGADPHKTLQACRAAATMKPGDIVGQNCGQINSKALKSSVLNTLRQCREDARKSQSGTASPDRNPER